MLDRISIVFCIFGHGKGKRPKDTNQLAATILNAIFTTLFACVTTIYIVKDYYREKNKDLEEYSKSKEESKEHSSVSQSLSDIKEELHTISNTLKDTSKVKVKIVE